MRDRLSFTRFLGLGFEDVVPDGTTLWLFREKLARAGPRYLEAKGYIARGGQMVDVTIVAVPKTRNAKEENAAVKAGRTPQAWAKNPAKKCPGAATAAGSYIAKAARPWASGCEPTGGEVHFWSFRRPERDWRQLIIVVSSDETAQQARQPPAIHIDEPVR